MSPSKHAVISTAIISAASLLITYFVSVNFFCKGVGISWLPRDFLLAIFGGVFASALVVTLNSIYIFKLDQNAEIFSTNK